MAERLRKPSVITEFHMDKLVLRSAADNFAKLQHNPNIVKLASTPHIEGAKRDRKY